jgi:hypothetical protein
VKRGEAERLVASLGKLIDEAPTRDSRWFAVERLWIEGEGTEYTVCVIFRQNPRPSRLGCRTRTLTSFLTEDRTLPPEQMAADIYDFVLIEPHDHDAIPADDEGVRWFADN